MSRYKLLAFLVLSLANLRGQSIVTSYTPRLVSGKGILDVTETYAPANATGFVRTVNVYNTDTATMRKYMVAEMAFQEAEGERLQTLADEARARADSLYAALELLNEGLGSADGPEPSRVPQPNDGPDLRWGAILKGDENEFG